MAEEQFLRTKEPDNVVSKFSLDDRLGRDCGSIFFSEDKESYHDNYANSQNQFKKLIDDFKNKYITLSSFCGTVKRKQRTVYECHGLGVDVDADCGREKIKKLMKNLNMEYPTFIVETESNGNYHFIYLFDNPVRVKKDKAKRMNDKLKNIQTYLAEKVESEFNRILDKYSVVDLEAIGSERYWSNPFNSGDKISWHSESKINFTNLKNNSTLLDKKTKNEPEKYKLSKNRQYYYGIAGFHTVNPFKIMGNVSEGQRHNTIKGKSVLSNAMGFTKEKTLSYAKDWWNKSQKEKNDMDWNEVEKTITDCYNPRYIRNDDELWQIYNETLEYYTIRKPLMRRKCLHKEEVIWAILKTLEQKGERVDITNWKEFRKEANSRLPSDAPDISETTFYRARRILIKNGVISFTKQKGYTNIRFYPSLIKKLNISKIGSVHTAYMRMNINKNTTRSAGSSTSDSNTYLICDLKEIAHSSEDKGKIIKIEKGFQTLYKDEWIIIEDKDEKSKKQSYETSGRAA